MITTVIIISTKVNAFRLPISLKASDDSSLIIIPLEARMMESGNLIRFKFADD